MVINKFSTVGTLSHIAIRCNKQNPTTALNCFLAKLLSICNVKNIYLCRFISYSNKLYCVSLVDFVKF